MEITTEHSLACMEIWGGTQAVDTSVSTPGLDLWVHSRPHEDADDGGDVHYVSLCGGGVITRFILADVSGHGSSVANLARSLRDLMRKNINRKCQDRLVNELNRQFAELAKLRRFATAVVGAYLTRGDRLTISNAGHPRPLWYQAGTGAWTILSGKDDLQLGLANLPLGIDDSTAYAQTEITLGQGDLVLFYTDALTEATTPQGKQLGEAGLLELVRFLDPTDPARLATTLIDKLDHYRGGRPAEDDLTFLLLHHNASPARKPGLVETLDVYAKVLGLKRI
jgi:serine phosphatase RsbU (regulator of sigma subunit)